MYVALEHINHIAKVGVHAMCYMSMLDANTSNLTYIERHGRTGRTIWNYSTGTLTPSKGSGTMLNWITLSISTGEKCAPCKL